MELVQQEQVTLGSRGSKTKRLLKSAFAFPFPLPLSITWILTPQSLLTPYPHRPESHFSLKIWKRANELTFFEIFQIHYGDYKAHSNSLPSKRVETVISRYFPKHLKEDSSDSEKRSLTLRMAEKWSTFHGWNVQECVDKYMENARRWPFFGSKLFKAQVC